MFGYTRTKYKGEYEYLIAYTTSKDGFPSIRDHHLHPLLKAVIAYYGLPSGIPEKVKQAMIKNTKYTWQDIWREIDTSKEPITEILLFKQPIVIYPESEMKAAAKKLIQQGYNYNRTY